MQVCRAAKRAAGIILRRVRAWLKPLSIRTKSAPLTSISCDATFLTFVRPVEAKRISSPDRSRELRVIGQGGFEGAEACGRGDADGRGGLLAVELAEPVAGSAVDEPVEELRRDPVAVHDCLPIPSRHCGPLIGRYPGARTYDRD